MTDRVSNTRQNHPIILDGIERLRSRWPSAHFDRGGHGGYLIIVPSVILPRCYAQTICTILFEAPPGFPAACPAHFFTDTNIRLANPTPAYADRPKDTLEFHEGLQAGNFPHRIWPAWKKAMFWKWRLQHWDPNRDSLYTFMNVIRSRFAVDTGLSMSPMPQERAS